MPRKENSSLPGKFAQKARERVISAPLSSRCVITLDGRGPIQLLILMRAWRKMFYNPKTKKINRSPCFFEFFFWLISEFLINIMDNNTELFQLLFYGKIVLKFLRKHHDLLHLLRKIHQILVLEILETRVILKQPDEKGLPIWNIYWLVPNEISFPFETKERKPFGKKTQPQLFGLTMIDFDFSAVVLYPTCMWTTAEVK